MLSIRHFNENDIHVQFPCPCQTFKYIYICMTKHKSQKENSVGTNQQLNAK